MCEGGQDPKGDLAVVNAVFCKNEVHLDSQIHIHTLFLVSVFF